MKPRAVGVVLAAAAALASSRVAAQTLTVCMAQENPPLSYQIQEQARGLDVFLARAIASELGRSLQTLLFESKYEQESTLSQEVNAMLSSGVCDIASGFALIASDLGAPTRRTAKVPDHPGAKRPPLRPWVLLGTLVPTRAYHAMAMGLVVRDSARESATLAEPGDARIGVVTGTLAGTVVSLYRNGKLRPQLVTLSQKQDALAELEAGHIDATLVPLDRFDAWRLAHPSTALRRAAYLHPRASTLALWRAAKRPTCWRPRTGSSSARWRMANCSAGPARPAAPGSTPASRRSVAPLACLTCFASRGSASPRRMATLRPCPWASAGFGT